MFEVFASAYFLGILITALACVFFLCVFFPSWYVGSPRRFWMARLTYEDDKEQQSFVRFAWLSAWLLTAIGSFLTAFNSQYIPHTFWWIFAQTLYGIILVWLVAKAIMVICILLQYIGLGFLRLKKWAFDGKPLFPKYNKLKPLEH